MPTHVSKPRRGKNKTRARSRATSGSRHVRAQQPRRPRRAARPRRSAGDGSASAAAAHELEHFVTVLRKCKQAVAGFSEEQKQRLRAIMAKAHRAIDRLHS